MNVALWTDGVTPLFFLTDHAKSADNMAKTARLATWNARPPTMMCTPVFSAAGPEEVAAIAQN